MKTAIESIARNLDPFERDCATTVALKISDDSCKMDDAQRGLFMDLYDAMTPYLSDLFASDIHDVIRNARTTPSAMVYARIKYERERAMETIRQDRMKAFKASIRARIAIAALDR